ncbi:hypothetical protein [Streptomyces sp. NPDC058735]|uniref:hypothetical protein n=1 Tax=unclassified Streptomyces TaxID=2593676 RepID=UPI00369F542F
MERDRPPVAVRAGPALDRATGSGTPTGATFAPARGSRIRPPPTSRRPDEARGAIRITRRETPAA